MYCEQSIDDGITHILVMILETHKLQITAQLYVQTLLQIYVVVYSKPGKVLYFVMAALFRDIIQGLLQWVTGFDIQ